MCSDFCHQYGSYRPRLIHSQPSGEALWENVAGLFLFVWLVLVKNQPGDEDMEDQRWNAAETKTTGNWEKSVHGACQLLILWSGGLSGLRRKQSRKKSHHSYRNGRPQCGYRGKFRGDDSLDIGSMGPMNETFLVPSGFFPS